MKVAFSPIYKYQLPEGHRFPMIKYDLLPEQLLREGTLQEDDFFHPEALIDEDILLTHTKEYLDQLAELSLTRKEARAIGFPVRPDLITRGRHIAFGTYQCALHAQQDGVSLNIAGGTHHAFADHGEGFCIFNDIAIASNMLLQNDLAKKILIIDLDVHQGNGTAHIFQGREEVFTLSVHGAKNYPVRKQQSDLDIGLPDGCEDKLYMSSLEQHLPEVIDEFEPDFIFYLSGVDILGTDKLGRLNVSRDGCKRRDQFIFDLCKQIGVPVAVSMGGGYSHQLRDIVEAHANTFRVAQEVYF